jgi:hypothetical protein
MTPIEIKRIETFIAEVIKLNPVYKIGGEGPGEFDCWKFARYTQKVLFGRDLPFISLGEYDDNIVTWIRLVAKYKTKLNWVETPKAEHGCLVEMSHKQLPYHIGTWLDIHGGGVLHCAKTTGVTFQSLHELRFSGWNRFVYDVPHV